MPTCEVCNKPCDEVFINPIMGKLFVHKQETFRGKDLLFVEQSGCQIMPDGEKISMEEASRRYHA